MPSSQWGNRMCWNPTRSTVSCFILNLCLTLHRDNLILTPNWRNARSLVVCLIEIKKSQSRKTNYWIKSNMTVESKVSIYNFNRLIADRCLFFCCSLTSKEIMMAVIDTTCRNETENTMFLATVFPLVSQVFQAASLLLQSWTWLPTIFRFLLNVAPTDPQPGMTLFCTSTPVTPLPHNTGNSCKAVLKHY